MFYQQFVKRALDTLLAAVALVTLLPMLGLAALLIKAEDRGPALFRQQRVGQHGRPFVIYKFRSMPLATPNVPSTAAGLAITRVGRVMRRSSIDELPQLWNVLVGDMSLIGPRPALVSQVELVAERVKRNVDALRPGLTGLAQVNAYDGMPEVEKAEWDGRYASHVTLRTDAVVVLRTLVYLLRKPPVY